MMVLIDQPRAWKGLFTGPCSLLFVPIHVHSWLPFFSGNPATILKLSRKKALEVPEISLCFRMFRFEIIFPHWAKTTPQTNNNQPRAPMRKQKIPNQLQNLTNEQLTEFHAWFPKFSYEQISEKLRASYGIEIGKAQLCRYYQRLEDADALSEGAEKPLTVAEYLAIQNGEPLPQNAPNADALKRQCLKLVNRPDQDPAGLLNLFRVFTYDQRREFAERRLEILQRTNALRERRLALKQISKPPESSQNNPQPDQPSPQSAKKANGGS
jgi:hypothetical protein